jgi:hypothetical protein
LALRPPDYGPLLEVAPAIEEGFVARVLGSGGLVEGFGADALDKEHSGEHAIICRGGALLG